MSFLCVLYYETLPQEAALHAATRLSVRLYDLKLRKEQTVAKSSNLVEIFNVAALFWDRKRCGKLATLQQLAYRRRISDDKR